MQMRNTKRVSVFPVAFSGGLAFEGPICKDGRAIDWQAVWQSKERYGNSLLHMRSFIIRSFVATLTREDYVLRAEV